MPEALSESYVRYSPTLARDVHKKGPPGRMGRKAVLQSQDCTRKDRRSLPMKAPSRSSKSVGKDHSVLRVLWWVQTNVCSRQASTNTHIYPSVLQAVRGRCYAGCLERRY